MPPPSGPPRLFDGSCDGGKIHVVGGDDVGFAGAGDVGDGGVGAGDSGGGDSGGVDSVGDGGGGGGGDSVSFLLPTLPAPWPALWCLLPARQEIRLPYCLAI